MHASLRLAKRTVAHTVITENEEVRVHPPRDVEDMDAQSAVHRSAASF